MTYTLIANSTSVTRDADQAIIPDDPRNADWQTYQLWLSTGNTPNPAPAPPPPPPPTLSFLQFMALFTSAEQDAIIASSDTQTKMFVIMAAGSGGLQLTNAQVIAGVNYLATATTASPPGPGLITAARATQILAGQAPS